MKWTFQLRKAEMHVHTLQFKPEHGAYKDKNKYSSYKADSLDFIS